MDIIISTVGVVSAITNVVLALAACYFEITYWLSARKKYKWAFIKLMYGIMFLYFAVAYIFVATHEPFSYDYVSFTQVFLRPAYTVLFGLLCFGAMTRRKQCR